ncbi:DUF3224 domain-containing protein [Paenibacillus antarcticus]|uniref:DUF3224 domain-containing protein n=1 Tax=Paenibacillus antarcticus TaxID=253703 RepID=A0A168PM90_9BACL|nr:DUF3224 domain-containing protein [Paenibacillus antarcticus]OAB46903.1 hypothetical protein PBAT_09580 [Paenibacillus antarcticus]
MTNSMQVKANFKLTKANEVIFSEIEGGTKLTQGCFTMEYSGGLHGEGVLQELKCYLPDGSATVYGLERITGCIEGKSGSLVLVHDGRYENGELTSHRKVMNGSGTGEWTGIFGEINFESGSADQFTITFDYYIE